MASMPSLPTPYSRLPSLVPRAGRLPRFMPMHAICLQPPLRSVVYVLAHGGQRLPVCLIWG